jgi:ribonucleoside-diphosphate reductase beta chain
LSVFNNKSMYGDSPLFFGESLGVARYDVQRYPFFDGLTEKQQGFFWRPQEIDLLRDAKDFKNLDVFEKHIFTSNLKRQILLDSVQGRAPVLAFLAIAACPELENWILAWSFFETIHSRSYTHIIQNVYSDPSTVFDGMLDIEEIVDCAKDISEYYDNLINMNNGWDTLLLDLKHVQGFGPDEYEAEVKALMYERKKALWLCLHAVNALEGIRFYTSFACSWAFAELKKMEGNAKIIKLIARDENLHLAGTQQLIKLLPKEDGDFARIEIELTEKVRQIYLKVINQEKVWAKYLFQHGSIIGLNEALLCLYVDWIAARRMKSAGVVPVEAPKSNPLPWTQKWIAGSEVAVAPQEVELSSYIIGGVKKNVTETTFKGFRL